MYNLAFVFTQFIIYSFLGYVCEVIYCSLIQRKIVNRGFLFGPLCPIYGFGAVLTIYSLSKYINDPIVVFILGMLITSTLEYFTSYVFEKIFNNKWWDYSNRVDSINGRVCLGNSILFGIGILVVLYIVNPRVDVFINIFSSHVLILLAAITFVVLIFDVLWSVIIAYNLKTSLIVAEELKKAKLKIIPSLFESMHKDQIAKIKFKSNRLIKNYPNLAKDLRNELSEVKKMVIYNKNVKKSKSKKGKDVKFM